MRCPFCTNSETIVKDSRSTDEGKIIRRRRMCCSCGGKYTTFERAEIRKIFVIKRSGTKRPFDKEKILYSISMAMRKRNFTEDDIAEIADRVVLEIESSSAREIHSRKIGNLIMRELAKVDQVAYIRFASVYKDFGNAQDFAKFISKIEPE